jgi:radical SAM protein with 4Fe4S-binding SPASM domain
MCYHWKRSLIVTTDGNVYTCPLYEGNPHPYFQKGKFGDIYTGIDETKLNEFYQEIDKDIQFKLTHCNGCENYNCSMCKSNRLVFLKFCPEALQVFCDYMTHERLSAALVFHRYQETPLIQSIIDRIDQYPYLHYEYIQDSR